MQKAQYIDSMRFFIPFVTFVWYNGKGRIAFTVMNTDPIREPLASERCTDQRPGIPCDFRHSILTHKTKVKTWKEMRDSRSREFWNAEA